MAGGKPRPQLPRPLRAARPFLALSLAAFALTAAPGGFWLASTTAGSLFLLAQQRLRRSIDRLILTTGRPAPSPLAEWRAGELTTPASRPRAVRPLRRLVRTLERNTLPDAAPVNRAVARG